MPRHCPFQGGACDGAPIGVRGTGGVQPVLPRNLAFQLDQRFPVTRPGERHHSMLHGEMALHAPPVNRPGEEHQPLLSDASQWFTFPDW